MVNGLPVLNVTIDTSVTPSYSKDISALFSVQESDCPVLSYKVEKVVDKVTNVALSLSEYAGLFSIS
jgi:hypothetical protein